MKFYNNHVIFAVPAPQFPPPVFPYPQVPYPYPYPGYPGYPLPPEMKYMVPSQINVQVPQQKESLKIEIEVMHNKIFNNNLEIQVYVDR